MFDFTKIFGQHEIDMWRDAHTLDAAAQLNEVAAGLACDFESEIKNATLKDLLNPNNFIATRVAPVVREASEQVVSKIIERANRHLQEIVAHQAVWNNIPRDVASCEDSGAAIFDIAVAAGPIAGSLVTAAALPTMAVTTTASLFGLITTTVISWPVVVVGATVAGAGLATGIFNAGKVRTKAEERLRKNIHKHVLRTLLQGTATQPALLEQLTQLFRRTAAEARKLP